ncbi:MAG: EamA family transporter [Thermoplasmata archaeon]
MVRSNPRRHWLAPGAVTMVGSITAAYPAITVVLAVTLLGEELQLVNALGIPIIIASMIGLSLSHGQSAGASGFSRVSLFLSIAALLLWGVGGIFIKAVLSELPLVMYLGLYPLILPPIAFAYLRHKRATKDIFFPKWSVAVIGAVVVAELWQLGYFSETAAVSEGAASIVFPPISAYPVVTIAAARFFLKESLSRTDWLLLVAVIIGIVLTSVV